MPRNREPESDWDDEDELPEGVYYDEEEPTAACPYCREPIYEGAQYCPKCENYLSREDQPPAAKPAWVWICLILALLASLWVLF